MSPFYLALMVTMVSLGSHVQATNPRSSSIEPIVSSPPRVSFSSDSFLDKNTQKVSEPRKSVDKDKGKLRKGEFEFLSCNVTTNSMLTADELISDGKLLPFSQMERLNKISLKSVEKNEEEEQKGPNKDCSRVSWYMDEDPSPRPPTCTVLWKELLKLKKHHTSALSSPSPSPALSSRSSSSSSSSSSNGSGHLESIEEGVECKEGMWNKEKHIKRIKKGLERTRSASFRIRPMVNVPVCTQVKAPPLHSMFALHKGNAEKK